MSQRFALFLSALITVIVMAGVAVVSRGIQAVAQMSAPEAAMAQAAEVPAPAATEPAPLIPPTAAPIATAQATTNATANATATSTYAVSADQAATLALNNTPGATLIRPAERVNFQGTVAYEVGLDAGKVYIDAQTGKVLYSEVAAAPAEGPVDQDQAVQIASAYMREIGDASEPVGVREGRSRRLRGMTLFEVTFADETRVYVNADTGEIVQANQPRERETHEGDDD